jgi:23S rRNA (adenine2030-N6)-methyltransferase
VNYRHAFHAGNFADVLKHAFLVRLLRSLQKKEKGYVFVDTHAGRGSYDLSLASAGDSRPRDPEWPDGIGRLWGRGELPDALRGYVEAVRAYDRSRGNAGASPRYYPGSPRLARLVSRPQDRLDLWERHPDECAALRDEFGGERRVAVHEADGYGAAAASLPPPERRALVLVDPPFEAGDEGSRVSAFVEEGMARFPGATFVVWHPISERVRTGLLPAMLMKRRFPSLATELVVRPGAPGMSGCGLVVVNPPWLFDGEARSILTYLRDVLYRFEGAQGDVRWIVSK